MLPYAFIAKCAVLFDFSRAQQGVYVIASGHVMAFATRLVTLLALGARGATAQRRNKTFFTAYGLECRADFGAWANMAFVRGPRALDDCGAAGMPAMISLHSTVWNTSALAVKNCTGSDGCLLPDWKEQWAKVAATAADGVRNGSVLGFNLGDELVCHNASLAAVGEVAERVRASFPSAVIWWNECGHTVVPHSQGQPMAGGKLPPAVDWFSADVYYAAFDPASSTWNHSVVALTNASVARHFHEQFVIPLLRPHQQVLLLPPAFGSACADRDPSVGGCGSMSCYDEASAAVVDGYAAWAREDARVAALAPYHYNTYGPGCSTPWDRCEVGFRSLPKTMAGWEAVGRGVVEGAP